MTAIAADGGRRLSGGGRRFAPFHKWDRGFILVMTLLMWLGIVAGFGSDSGYPTSGRMRPPIR